MLAGNDKADDIAIFEVYLCERAAYLSSQFDALDRGKLTTQHCGTDQVSMASTAMTSPQS